MAWVFQPTDRTLDLRDGTAFAFECHRHRFRNMMSRILNVDVDGPRRREDDDQEEAAGEDPTNPLRHHQEGSRGRIQHDRRTCLAASRLCHVAPRGRK